MATLAAPASPGERSGVLLKRLGDGLQRHARALRALQWGVVAVYVFLITVPAFLPLPPDDARAFDHLVVFAQWMFWGLWWPFVLLSMLVIGRTWCGLFCPEGTLTEAASRIGLNRHVPRWLRWGGWPFVAFALTTIYGQLVSAYQYAQAALLVLGGSTLAAIAVGFVYGREKRVWCRYLCPVNGVFALLARLSPLHYRVDAARWKANAGHIRIHPVNCAPMVRIRRMTGASECHMCARCSGHLDAVALSARAPNREIAALTADAATRWDAVLIVFGLIGIAIGAFQWTASPWLVELKLAVATWAVDRGHMGLLRDNAPWWLLTHYPEAHDVFTWLDGIVVVGYIVATAAILGGSIWACLRLASSIAYRRRVASDTWRLAYALMPIAGLGLFLGLSSLTVALMKGEGWTVPALRGLRACVIAGGALWSVRLAWLQLADAFGSARRVVGVALFAGAVVLIAGAWALLYFRWT